MGHKCKARAGHFGRRVGRKDGECGYHGSKHQPSVNSIYSVIFFRYSIYSSNFTVLGVPPYRVPLI